MLAQQIRTLLTKLAEAEDADFSVERPKQPEHGDYASNVAMVLGKKRGVNPRSLAEQLQEKLSTEEMFNAVEVAGPGFLNFRLSPAAWQGVVAEILEADKDFGRLPETGRKIQVEFISANPTGPLTLGNGRGGYGGDVLANVVTRAGHTVSREYYLNDAGFQVEQLGATLRGEEDAYKGEYVAELKTKVDTAKTAAEVGAEAAALMTEEIRKTIERMGIRFDDWFSERKELHETGEIERVLAGFEKIDAAYEKDGALWLKTTHHDDDKDRVLRKSDGALTYFAADLAYHYHKLAKRQLDLAIDIWGADHHGYIKRMEAGVEFLRQADHFDGKLQVLVTQLVRLTRGGQEVKMSKRAGTYVALDELLAEIPSDVARFFFVMRGWDTHMDFDLDLAKEQSQKNPVYYLKYAYARVAGILRQAGRGAKKKDADLGKLVEPAEFALVQELSAFPEVIRQTAEDYQIQRVPHYALGVADAFHKFYEQCRVVSDDKELTAARLRLVEATKLVLEQVGETVGIELPEKL